MFWRGVGESLGGLYSGYQEVNGTWSARYLRSIVIFSNQEWRRVAKTSRVLGLTNALDNAADNRHVRM